jgi:hypothetical protein
MGVDKKISDLVKSMILCHENGDFVKLKTLMDKSTLEAKDTFLTQEKFDEVSQKIHEQLGNFIKIEYIGFLNKIDSIHTLWKAKYSNSEEDALWQARINLDDKDPKIIRMSIN